MLKISFRSLLMFSLLGLAIIDLSFFSDNSMNDLWTTQSSQLHSRSAGSQKFQQSQNSRSVIIGKKGKPVTHKNEAESKILLNDPSMSMKWDLAATDASRAWKVTQGSKDIIVAIIDTGVSQHDDLKNNFWINKAEKFGKPGVDDDHNGYIDDIHGWNFVNNNNEVTDRQGHGTHIAGIIGAEGGNGKGVIGISPKVSLMILKYYDAQSSGESNLRNTINAIRYAVKNGAHIINYSAGGPLPNAEERSAIAEAQRKGVIFVSAAGNDRSDSDKNHYYPASYDLDNIISVTAIDPDLKILPSSNYGIKTVDIAAPGKDIYSTSLDNTYSLMTGTSQATAFVSGVAALIKAHNRELSAPQVIKYILATGDFDASLKSKTGTARKLNSYKALVTLDHGVSASGVLTSNTQKMSNSEFASDTNEKTVSVAPTDFISYFGRQVVKKLESQNRLPSHGL